MPILIKISSQLTSCNFPSKLTLKITIFLKCQPPMPTCTPGGPDKICSDGKCYLSTSACPTGTFLATLKACTCASNCTATTSSLQVKYFWTIKKL
jgi:hypothetical protein